MFRVFLLLIWWTGIDRQVRQYLSIHVRKYIMLSLYLPTFGEGGSVYVLLKAIRMRARWGRDGLHIPNPMGRRRRQRLGGRNPRHQERLHKHFQGIHAPKLGSPRHLRFP